MSTKPTIKVRTKDVIFIHWFNAFLWLALVLGLCEVGLASWRRSQA